MKCCGYPSKKTAIVVVCAAVGIPLFNRLMNSVVLPDTAPSALFDPNQTDLISYGNLTFLSPDQEYAVSSFGLEFILSQSILPKWMAHLMFQGHAAAAAKIYKAMAVDILDARKQEFSFHETGFTLLEMDEPSKTKNWRSTEDIKAFREEIRPRLMELYPNATRIEFTYNVVRGGSTFGDQPAAINVPHLDYSQNDAERVEFHQKYPPFNQTVEQFALLGDLDTEEDYMGTLLGIWKPIYMSTPVCDHPLAVMDARTFDADHERPNYVHISFGFFSFHNLNAAILYDPRQKWYYYPLQMGTEVLVFTQYTRDRHFATPHGSFDVQCPTEDFDTPRVSVEMRAAVFFPKQSKEEDKEDTEMEAPGIAPDEAVSTE